MADRAVAVRRLGADALHATRNADPMSSAGVLSLRLAGSPGEPIFVALPLRKHRFDLCTGECLEHPEPRVAVHGVRPDGGCVLVTTA